MVAREQLFDIARDLHARSGKHDDVVAHALDVGYQVRRENDADRVFGDTFHQVLKKLVPSQRIETRHRFVEYQQLRSFRERESECELRALAA